MGAIARSTLAAACLLLVTGCVTDEPAVFKKNVLSKEEMKPLLGVHQVEQWPGDMKPDRVRVSEQDGKLYFAYSLPDNEVRAQFVLSKVPNSKKGLLLLSIPKQKQTNQANIFFVGRVQEGKSHLWIVVANMPVVEGQLEFQGGKARAEDLKKFLAKHGDAFVAANKPPVTLVKQDG